MINSRSERSNTGYKGISLRLREGRNPKYQVQLDYRHNGKRFCIHIANTNTLEEAILARQQFIKSLF